MDIQNWYAWINLMPPKPDDFHVVGDVYVGNPGIEGQLNVRALPSINPNVLLLDLHLVQRPGMWPQVMTWIQVRFDKVLPLTSPKYKEVEIFYDNISIAQLTVDEIS